MVLTVEIATVLKLFHQAGGDPVEHDDAADFVGDHNPVGKLVRENQAPDRDRAFGKRADAGNLTIGSIGVPGRPGRLRER